MTCLKLKSSLLSLFYMRHFGKGISNVPLKNRALSST